MFDPELMVWDLVEVRIGLAIGAKYAEKALKKAVKNTTRNSPVVICMPLNAYSAKSKEEFLQTCDRHQKIIENLVRETMIYQLPWLREGYYT